MEAGAWQKAYTRSSRLSGPATSRGKKLRPLRSTIVPESVATPMVRRLGALARARSTSVVLRPLSGSIPTGVTHLQLESLGVEWHGTGMGRGRLSGRTMTVAATGKGVGGIRQVVELEDDGADAVRVVSRLAVAMPERAVG